MNMKVVVVWAFAIILFAGLGIFGYFNQDLLVLNDDTPYVPIDLEDSKAHTCTRTMAVGKSDYKFLMDPKTKTIIRVTSIYTATAEDIDAYTAATNISNASIPGVSAVITGGISDFGLVVQINVSTVDKNSLEYYADDFAKLSIVIDNTDDYETYKSLINTVDSVYTCD